MDNLHSQNPFQANSQQNPTGNRFQQTRVATWNDSGGIGDLNLRINLMPWSQAMRDKVLDYVNNGGIPQQLEMRRLEVLDYLGGQADIILSQEHKGKGCDKDRKDFPGNQFSMEPRKDSQMNYTTMKKEITSSVDDEVVLYRSDLFEKVELPENLNVGTGFAVVMLKNKQTGGFVLAISRHHSFEEDKFNNESNSNNFILKLNGVLNALNVDMKNLSVVVGADANISASEEQSQDMKGIHTLLRENGFTIDEGTSNEPTCFFRNTPAHADTIKVKNGFNSKGVRVVTADTLGLKSWAALDQFVPKGEDAGQVVSFGYQTVQVKEFAPNQLDEKGFPKGLREVLVHLFPSDHLPMIMDFMDPAAAAEQFVDILDEMILSPASKKDVNGKEQIPDPAALALRKMLFERKILVEGKNWGNYSKSETLKLARENFSQYIPELKKLHSELIAKLVNDQTKKLNPEEILAIKALGQIFKSVEDGGRKDDKRISALRGTAVIIPGNLEIFGMDLGRPEGVSRLKGFLDILGDDFKKKSDFKTLLTKYGDDFLTLNQNIDKHEREDDIKKLNTLMFDLLIKLAEKIDQATGDKTVVDDLLNTMNKNSELGLVKLTKLIYSLR